MDIPRLHPDTIEQVRQRADIVDVVSEHVVLRKLGKDFTGLCPFHDDKSPSFTVSPSKQFYYCFSCGAGGNAIKFLMELGKHSFSEVVLDLAKRYQVSVQTLEPEQRQELQRQISVREQLHEILALTARFFEHALNQPQGKAALEYLTAKRKLSTTTIQQFQLGYAPAGWETLFGYLVEQKHYPVALVERAGLIVPRKGATGSYYDRFRDRLMIPIHDLQGRVVGFGGRSLGDEQPKYLNSPETELFDKGNILFALDKARAAIAKQDQAVVVEGYFDVIALHSAGITNVVASMGTALSLAQVRQLLRYTESKRIVFNFDADRAGTQAAERAIGEVAALAYQGEVQLRILNIPTGKDPDEFLQTNTPADYQQLLDESPLWLDWQIQQAIAGQDLNQADQFQQVVQQIVDLLADVTNANTRTHYIGRCAEILSRKDGRLVPLLAENLLVQVRRKRRPSAKNISGDSSFQSIPNEFLITTEAVLLRVYLHYPEYRQAVITALEERDLQFSFSHHRFLWRQILKLQDDLQEKDKHSEDQSYKSISTSESIVTQPNLISFLRDLCTVFPKEMEQVYHLFELDEKTRLDIVRVPLIIRSTVACIERTMCDNRYRDLLQQWKETDCSMNPERAKEYSQKIYAEKKRIEELDQQQRWTKLEDLIQTPSLGKIEI
ncbi:MAG: DNA primase [Tildeniella nuda ZEHNDER 1965/U140]|jgi:DNA primase|nr:DNA primase [Tildeniella nuda ZEHNDER 1965/U140]